MMHINKTVTIFIFIFFIVFGIQPIVNATDLTDEEMAIFDNVLAPIDSLIQDTSDGVDITNGVNTNLQEQKVKNISLKLQELCANNNISMDELAKVARKVNPHFLDTSNVFYKIYREAENENLNTQVSNPNKTQEEKTQLENSIKTEIARIRLNPDSISTEELLKIDAMLKEYSSKYPSEFASSGSEMYLYASEISNLITARKDLEENYDTAAREEANKRQEEEKKTNSNNKPSTGVLGSSDASASHTLGEIASEAKGFLSKGTVAIPFNEGNLKGASDTLFNILLGIGLAAAVIIGIYLGIKFMMSTVEDKAKVKEALIPYSSIWSIHNLETSIIIARKYRLDLRWVKQ